MTPASLMLLFSVLVSTTLLLLVDHFRHLHHLGIVDNLDVVDRLLVNNKLGSLGHLIFGHLPATRFPD